MLRATRHSTHGQAPDVQTHPSNIVLRVGYAALGSAVLFGTLSTQGVAASSTSQGPRFNCSASYDTYAVSASTLRTCGVGSYPLAGTVRLSDGGLSYRYDIMGHVAWQNIPPAHFNALTASPTELALYGIPAEPPVTDATARAQWIHMATHLNFVAPPSEMHTVPGFVSEDSKIASTQLQNAPSSTYPNGSTNWSGYVAYGQDYSTVGGSWVEPILSSSHCKTNSVAFWAGLGGYNTAALAQDGTAEYAPGLQKDQGWWEILPKTYTPIAKFEATEGQWFEASTTHDSGNTFTFFLYNAYTDQGVSVGATGTSTDLSTADVIVERPTLSNGQLSNLSNFATMELEATADSVPMSHFSNWDMSMYNTNGGLMAQPSLLSTTDGKTFLDTQHSCD